MLHFTLKNIPFSVIPSLAQCWQRGTFQKTKRPRSNPPPGPSGRVLGLKLLKPCHTAPLLIERATASMVFAVFSSHAAYNDSITVRTPAPPRPHLAFSRGCLPRAPETCTTFTRGCMTSVARPTQIERPPGACLKFWRGSGLPGRTLWGVFMDHLEFGEQTVPLRAARDGFPSIRGTTFGQVILFFDRR